MDYCDNKDCLQRLDWGMRMNKVKFTVEYKGGNTSTNIELWRHKQQISNALAEIDKVIGGKEE